MSAKSNLLHQIGENEALVEIIHMNSEKEHQRFIRFNTIWKNIEIIVLTLLIIIVSACSIILFDGKIIASGVFAVSACLPFLMLLSCIVCGKIYLKCNKNYLMQKNTYKFYDELIYVKIEDDKVEAETVSAYGTLSVVWITKNYIYIYLTKTRAIIIDRNELTNEQFDRIMLLLEKSVKKTKIKRFLSK